MSEQDRTTTQETAAREQNSPEASRPAQEATHGTTRRHAIAGAGLIAGSASVLAACGDGHSEAGKDSNAEKSLDPKHPVDIAATSDVPVGGTYKATSGDTTAMLSQPEKGKFHAFSAVCTHQGCTLNAQNKQFVCPCHSSVFSSEDGSVQGGPAKDPLTEYKVSVKGDRITIS